MLLFGLTIAALMAQAPPAKKVTRQEFEAKLHYQRGKIELSGGIATLKLDENFRFLNGEDAEKVLTEAWGNPPGSGALGIIFPAKMSALDDGSWGVIITYQDDGFVNDDDADKMDYGKLLEEMKTESREANEERKKEGYEPVEVIGWAAPPRYDRAAHKLYWAKELKFGKSPEHTLNYNIRVLGRRGVLVLNAVASKSDLLVVQTEIPKLLPMVEFEAGSRYSDFVPSADKVAVYGVGALVAGKLAAKAGMLKWLFGILIAAKKPLILALVGLGAYLKRFLRRRKPEPESAVAIEPEPAADSQ